MTQEQKDLLLKDLCARLPYKIKGYVNDNIEILEGVNIIDSIVEYGIYCNASIDEFTPYLFPLSSMTEEQENEWCRLHIQPLLDRLGVSNRKEDLLLQAKSLDIGIDWLNAHHFDYRGLINKGLAIDATGLNIY